MLHMQVRMLYAATPICSLDKPDVAITVSTVVVPEPAVNLEIAYSSKYGLSSTVLIN